MKIEIVKSELPRFEVDCICEVVNSKLEDHEWGIEMYDNMPSFFSNGEGDEWEIRWDEDNRDWRLTYNKDMIGVVEFDDDHNILWNWK